MIISSNNVIHSNSFSVKEIPRFNEIGFIPGSLNNYEATQPFSYTSLIKLLRQTPEVIGILRVIQTDICSDGYRFIGANKNIMEAEKFAKDNRLKSQLMAAVFDWLMLGNGALWKAKPDKKRIKEYIDKAQITTGVEIKEIDVKALMNDEDIFKTKQLKHAPWSTMQIDLNKDKTSVSAFRQIVPGDSKAISFHPEEIIHAKFMEFDGKVHGFAPLESAVNVLSTLVLIKDLNGAFFSNGGVPDWMFIFAKEMAGSPNVKLLEQTLRHWRNNQNKHGNLVFTGEVEAKELNKFDKDMEFRQLAIHYTGIIALAYNVPLSRVAPIIGAEVKAGAAASDLSEAAYWRQISCHQDYWEDLLNSQLFVPEFKVEIKFNRGYLNDEIKEAQRDVQKFQVLKELALAGSIKEDFIKEQLKIPDKYWTGKFEPVQKSSGFGGDGGSPGSVPKNDLKGSARQENVKRKTEQANMAAERKENSKEEDNNISL